MTTETRRTLPQPNDPNREPIINSPTGFQTGAGGSTLAQKPTLPPRQGAGSLRTSHRSQAPRDSGADRHHRGRWGPDGPLSNWSTTSGPLS